MDTWLQRRDNTNFARRAQSVGRESGSTRTRQSTVSCDIRVPFGKEKGLLVSQQALIEKIPAATYSPT
jgi:hypothetical protein